MQTTLEAAAGGFLEFARRARDRVDATGAELVDWAVNYYREIRVAEADVASQADMLLLQWGRTRPWLLTEPTDLRDRQGGPLEATVAEHCYVAVTRQLFAFADGDADEFDESAIHLNLMLVYGEASGGEPDGNLWAETPEQAAASVAQMQRETFVARLLPQPPERLVATIDWAG